MGELRAAHWVTRIKVEEDDLDVGPGLEDTDSFVTVTSSGAHPRR